LGHNTARIPERLLLAHARGEVLFITGAGISRPAGLPDFRGLVLEVYQRLDAGTYAALNVVPLEACNRWSASTRGLSSEQSAEVSRFVQGDYDVVLGMLERRMDGTAARTTTVRHAIADVLRQGGSKPAPIHKAMIRLADRGTAMTIVTTNFDLLLENAARLQKKSAQSFALGGIPRPGRSGDFAGILHIHGALARDSNRTSDLIVTDQDFGEFYLRRRAVPDFIYDAARLFHLVLVGYSANDAPMRYLLNAVASDGSRFDDLKERFAFVSMAEPTDPVAIEDWKGRGITPIPYSMASGHAALTKTLQRWSDLSAINGKQTRIDAELKRIVRQSRATASEADRDLFDHLVRRGSSNERDRIASLVSNAGAILEWLDAILAIRARPAREGA
jgi:NAD-dependent SIR2 family protein deacetylase